MDVPFSTSTALATRDELFSADEQLALHHRPEPLAGRQFRRLGSARSSQGVAVGPAGSIAAPSAVDRDLSRDRRRCPPQPAGDGAERLTARNASGYLLALGQREPHW